MDEREAKYRVMTYGADGQPETVQKTDDAATARETFHGIRDGSGWGMYRGGVKLQVRENGEWATVYDFRPGDAEHFKG